MPAIALAESQSGRPESESGRLKLYASLGPRLLQYAVDESALTLTGLSHSVMLPENIQYACADRMGRRFLYVLSSNGGPGIEGTAHYATSFRADPGSGALHQHGARIPLLHRPIHITTDRTSEYALIAYTSSRSITVLRINGAGTMASEVEQPADLDAGCFAHQIYVMPSNETVIVVARGADATLERLEHPGALHLFKFDRGLLKKWKSIAPKRGYGFGPRNIDINPSRPWLYASLERQNKLHAFKLEGECVSEEPQFVCETLINPSNIRPKQMAGAIRVHPTGKFVYLANRAFGTTESNGKKAYVGGENTIVVYEIDEVTGKPGLIQSTDTHGIYPRTFSIDPAGKLLIVANTRPLLVSNGTAFEMVPPNLSIFSIGEDGMLRFARKYEMELNGQDLFWSGLAVHR